MKTLQPVVFVFVCVTRLPLLLWGQERPPIIDMHLHAHHPEVPAGIPELCRPEPCRGEGRATATSAESLQKTLEAMQRYNIVKGFLSGPTGF